MIKYITLFIINRLLKEIDCMKVESATELELVRAWKALEDSGAYVKGHFFLPSTGKHYDEFFQMAKALQYTKHARTLCIGLARILRRSGILHKIEKGKRFTILAPADAGIPVAFWMGENLGSDRILWVSKYEDKWDLRPLVKMDENDVIILVDDTTLTGNTINQVMDFVKVRGAQVIAVAVIVDRRSEKGEFNGLPVFSIIKAEGSTFDPDSCPMCTENQKLVEIRL